MKNIGIVASVSLLILLYSSCHKKNTSFNYTIAVETVVDYVKTQQMTDLLLGTYFKSITDSILLVDSVAIIDGANVSLSYNPTTIEFNYSSTDGDDGYGHNRKGKYTAVSTSNFINPEAEITFTFQNFKYDFDTISTNSFILTNTGFDNNNNYVYNLIATNVLIKFYDTTGTVNFNIDQRFIRVKDPASDYYTYNDYFEIEGSNTGVARNGYQYNSATIDSDNLIMNYSCNWLSGGSAFVQLPQFVHDAEVNFFNSGNCINKYSIITNGTLFEKSFDLNQ